MCIDTVCMSIYMYTHTYVHVHLYMYICIYVYVYIHRHIYRTRTHTHSSTCAALQHTCLCAIDRSIDRSIRPLHPSSSPPPLLPHPLPHTCSAGHRLPSLWSLHVAVVVVSLSSLSSSRRGETAPISIHCACMHVCVHHVAVIVIVIVIVIIVPMPMSTQTQPVPKAGSELIRHRRRRRRHHRFCANVDSDPACAQGWV